jgi:hypothetical protein
MNAVLCSADRDQGVHTAAYIRVVSHSLTEGVLDVELLAGVGRPAVGSFDNDGVVHRAVTRSPTLGAGKEWPPGEANLPWSRPRWSN